MGCLQDPGGTCSRLFPRAQGVSRAANGFESDSDSEHEHGVRAASGCRVTPALAPTNYNFAGKRDTWGSRSVRQRAAAFGCRPPAPHPPRCSPLHVSLPSIPARRASEQNSLIHSSPVAFAIVADRFRDSRDDSEFKLVV
ncbi:hypothetical protein PF005_g21134 [Phytophthora fragariae]|uniref:Uncharacterized protein n=1 Tax=Phytophthora fragariae TaxID=53985 RepID=A0A6A3J5C3_9STRA|nr:hypothetical protein PF011_g19892 [Phytophthora fragariae]KAE9103566.1 hypothetical protein PF006_g22145 [Phytophthora fragariae]KAE9185732.1 hypothetical protein PF005_g21134 [Phytophthora fragariae]KAE9196801.1 hypothetical protein PF004_g20033 [Phytophthora fragariae]